eukprot:TRINITY_DN18430_c0_g1_i3.p2 TRINITY_DN18430_c0_g1~~TRINITY_DN18430_c0_g1_i3.p2  ORF type:complete len:341 (-),score=31.10 TRINITY_DN18430_c0_g1_i3:247-1269(-)
MYPKNPSHSRALGPGCGGPLLGVADQEGIKVQRAQQPTSQRQGNSFCLFLRGKMYPKNPSHSRALGPGCGGPLLGVADQEVQKRRTVFQPTCGAEQFVIDHKLLNQPNQDGVIKHTQSPIVTGSSVLGIKYQGGVLLACDTLASYGSTKRYKSVSRIFVVNSTTMIAGSGELSDLTHLQELLDQLTLEDFWEDDGIQLGPKEVHSYLTRVLYNKRNDFDPLWNSLVVAGIEKGGEPFLANVNMIGVHFQDDHICTGLGSALVRPVFRDQYRADLSADEAIEIVKHGLELTFYRDTRTINKFIIGKCDAKDGASISDPFVLPTKWGYKKFENPDQFSVGAW